MTDSVFHISVDLGHLVEGPSPLSRETLPALAHAVQAIAAAAHARWSAFASGIPIPPNGKVINNRTGEYLRSIMLRTTGDFAAEVYSELPYARAIEEGSPARDMKKMLDTSLKVRLTKTGKRYLIIPFRHNVNSVLGNNMPAEVHNWWQKEERERSRVTGSYLRPSGTGAFHWRDGKSFDGRDVKKGERILVPGWRYKYGSRLGTADLEGLGFHKDDKVTKRLKGMLNFRAVGGAGGGAHSQYITFRVMMEGGKGWMAPARAGLFPARQTAAEIRPVAEKAFAAAVEHDIRRMLGGSSGA